MLCSFSSHCYFRTNPPTPTQELFYQAVYTCSSVTVRNWVSSYLESLWQGAALPMASARQDTCTGIPHFQTPRADHNYCKRSKSYPLSCWETWQSFCFLSLDIDLGRRNEIQQEIGSDKTSSSYPSAEVVLLNYTCRTKAFHLLHTRDYLNRKSYVIPLWHIPCRETE